MFAVHPAIIPLSRESAVNEFGSGSAWRVLHVDRVVVEPQRTVEQHRGRVVCFDVKTGDADAAIAESFEAGGHEPPPESLAKLYSLIKYPMLILMIGKN